MVTICPSQRNLRKCAAKKSRRSFSLGSSNLFSSAVRSITDFPSWGILFNVQHQLHSQASLTVRFLRYEVEKGLRAVSINLIAKWGTPICAQGGEWGYT